MVFLALNLHFNLLLQHSGMGGIDRFDELGLLQHKHYAFFIELFEPAPKIFATLTKIFDPTTCTKKYLNLLPNYSMPSQRQKYWSHPQKYMYCIVSSKINVMSSMILELAPNYQSQLLKNWSNLQNIGASSKISERTKYLSQLHNVGPSTRNIGRQLQKYCKSVCFTPY